MPRRGTGAEVGAPVAERARGLLRVVPFIKPHRATLFWSVGFAFLVALFWGANLGLILPVINVLAGEGSVTGYVEGEIAVARGDQDHWTIKLENAEAEAARLAADPNASRSDTVEAAAEVAKAQDRLSKTARKLEALNWVQQYVTPILPEDKFDLLATILAVVFLATILKGLCVMAQDILVGAVIERTIADLREALFAHALRLDIQTLHASGTGDLMSRFTNDLEQLAGGLRLLGGKVVREPMKAAACIFGAMLVSWQLTLLAFVLTPVAAYVFGKIGRSLKKASRRSMESMSRLYKTMEETFDGAAVVTAFNAADRQKERFRNENRTYLQKAMKIVRVDALTSPTTETLGMLAAFGALLPAAYLMLRETDSIWGLRLADGQLDLAELAVFYSFLAGTLDPLRKLTAVFSKLKRSTAAADRLFEILDRDPAVAAPAEIAPVPDRVHTVKFEKIGFHYAGAARGAVLDGVNLTVEAGEVVAVVGSNGSGKSTLLKLLPRYFDPTHGAVTINGTDLRDFDPAAWREKIGVVTQETLLFDESIAENIRVGKPDATEDEIRAAARTARVTDFADTMPNGLDEIVGSGGSNLSGGQRQRVAFARAVLRDPEILILDEATSAVDALSEQLIHEALKEFAAGRTVFLVTHTVRRSLLELVTRVAVMEQGQLAGVGPHLELLESSAAYRGLYEAQSDEAAAAARAEKAASRTRTDYRPMRSPSLHPGAINFDPDEIDQYDPADRTPPRKPPGFQPDPVAYHYASVGQIFDPDEVAEHADDDDEDDSQQHILPLRATGTDG
ncbi:Lipid A export ATP-binding/permease protein MsbA [Alienimonas californiensis]|uniref:Lipid A export ATP-binding/permease protein MsbA n=2 Tax=Alienimonas californiensis TaxID=2527989 RepID=A0A517P540_9PLAN|nr:Lipid A export ATP-binding/permease protein MsbA [Alienimonas californiensis]